MDYNKIAQEVHEENKIKGFYDIGPNKDMSLLLIVSELMEMVEADRKGRTLSSLGQIIATNLYDGDIDDIPSVYKSVFEDDIKDTIEDEAAGVILRILDYAGWQGISLECERDSIDFHQILESKSLEANDIFDLIKGIEYCRISDESVAYSFHVCLIYFKEALKIDIWKYVELKRKYNKLRPIRNGKRY